MLDTFIGDANAKLTVSMEISDKEYGRGVSVMASLTLTVNQDDAAVESAFSYARALLHDKISETVPHLNEAYDELKKR
jgi:hypothetical protein